MELTKIRAEYELKQQQISNEIELFIEAAINYDELLEDYNDKSDIDYEELIFNDAKDMRYFENLESTSWMLKQVLEIIDEYIGAGDDKKKAHRAKKEIEMLITSMRGIRKESKEIMEREQQVINEADLALKLLDQLRNK